MQEQQQGYACGCGQDGAHPEAQLAEVAVLYDGQDGGAAQEHHHLEDKDNGGVKTFYDLRGKVSHH